MFNATQTMIRRSQLKEGEPLNILTFPTHERYQENLAKTNHNFYLLQGEHIKPWNEKYAKLPSNHYLLNPKNQRQLPLHITIDLVLSQNKFGQFEIAKQIADRLQCPLISLEHTLPPNGSGTDYLTQMFNKQGNINIFISEFSKNKWGWEKTNAAVIHHGIDTENFIDRKAKREKIVCSIVNDWIDRDQFCGFNFWQQVTGQPNPLFDLNVWGDTPNLSTSTKNISHLIDELNRSLIYLNTSLVSPIPTSLLEAMACGCIPVSTSTCMIPQIIKHEYNGFISNDPLKLRKYIQEILEDPEKYKEISINARKTIGEMFSLEKFVDNWNNIFYKCVGL